MDPVRPSFRPRQGHRDCALGYAGAARERERGVQMTRKSRLWSIALRAMTVLTLLMTSVGLSGPVALADREDGPDSPSHPRPAATCQLGVQHGNGHDDGHANGHGNGHDDIQHVIYVQFDNTHFNRD